jgi:hypothetical protein
VKAKAYLRQIKLLDAKIEIGMEELEQAKAMATKVTSVMSGDVVSRTRNTDTMTDAVAKIIELQDKLNQNIDRFVDAKNEVLQMLSKVENPNYYRLLHSRYILYKKWEQIAYEMNYTYRGITKMHGKALLAFESVLESACCS